MFAGFGHHSRYHPPPARGQAAEHHAARGGLGVSDLAKKNGGY